MNKKHSFLIKISVSSIFIIWAIVTDQFNWSNIVKGISDVRLLLIFTILTLIQLLIGSFRTQSLMQFSNFTWYQLFSIFKVTWASSFIGTVSPFGIVGDVFRIKELMLIDTSLKKDNILYTSIFSKIFSTFALVVIVFISGLFISRDLPEVKIIGKISKLIIASGVVFYFFKNKIIFYLDMTFEKITWFKKTEFIKNRITNLRNYWKTFITFKKLSRNLFLSILIQIINTASIIAIIYCMNPELDISVLELAFVVPIGIFLIVLPISYSGLGVGHIAFSKLLAIYGIESGADIFSLFFVYSLVFNFLGSYSFFQLSYEKLYDKNNDIKSSAD